MSAVSSESTHANGSSRPGEAGSDPAVSQADFGANEWLVEELYQRYQADPSSVDRAWWSFFADYTPTLTNGTGPQPVITASRAAAEAARVPQAPQAPAPPPPPGQAAPARPAQPVTAPAAQTPPPPAVAGAEVSRLRGAAARTVTNMTASLAVPTATSVRSVPAKLLVDNRIVINNHLKRGRGGKVSFTHLIGYAVVQALLAMPEMNDAYTEEGGKPAVSRPEHVNLGLAIDVQAADGSRQLLVPNVKSAEEMDFRLFWTTYEDIVRRARAGKLTVEDFQGTTASLTNPGTIGTVHSVPRLMPGQGCIIGVGAMEYPAEYAGASEETLARLAISKAVTLTSTYDHRIIQGAQSGEFLKKIHELLLGEDGFYDQIFAALRIPYEPVRWVRDFHYGHEDDVDRSARVTELIHAYRVRGHLMADTNPLEVTQRKHPDLDLNQHGLTLWDLEREFPTGGFGGKRRMLLRDILGVLRDSYCRTIGTEYMHIQDPEERRWLQARIEITHPRAGHDEQMHILGRLNVAEAFEMFLQTKYVGQRRFSLEGAESLIPLVDAVLAEAADADLDEAVIGMAHRGRLNVLANIVGKSYGQIFKEFEGNPDPGSVQGSGDVKYHLGAEGVFLAPDGRAIKTSLVANPSHLEAGDPVTEGVVRAKQDVIDKGEPGFTVLPVLIHGDAAFAGQGVVAETLNLSQLRGYRTGGTVHIIVNNQVGFTTAPQNARSSEYATDVARMIQAPIFHVNGDDPEAVVWVARLAFAYRQTFKKDVVIDMLCYRKRGHNETDNPSFTQPLMYDLVEARRSTRKVYTESLIARGDITMEEAEAALRDFQQQLERAFTETRDAATRPGRARHRAQARAGGPPGQPPGRAHCGTGRGGQADHRHPGQPARRLHRPPAAEAAAGAARGHGRGRRDRLGHRRAAGHGLAGHRRPHGAAAGPGHPARHVRPAARGAGRPAERPGAHAAEAVRLRPGQVLRIRLAAVGVRGHGLRVRLLGGPAGRAGLLGSAVRRLRRAARRRSSTSSSAPASRSGASAPASSCCCRTATTARARTTPRPGSSGSCRCARRTT